MFSRRELVGLFLSALGTGLFFGAPVLVVSMLERRPSTILVLRLFAVAITLAMLAAALYMWRRGPKAPESDPTKGRGILLTSMILVLIFCVFAPVSGAVMTLGILAVLHHVPEQIITFQTGNPFTFFQFLASFSFIRQVAVVEEIAAVAWATGGVLTLPGRLMRYYEAHGYAAGLKSSLMTPDQAEARRLRGFAAFLFFGGIILGTIGYYTPLTFFILPAAIMFIFSIPIYLASQSWEGW